MDHVMRRSLCLGSGVCVCGSALCRVARVRSGRMGRVRGAASRSLSSRHSFLESRARPSTRPESPVARTCGMALARRRLRRKRLVPNRSECYN